MVVIISKVGHYLVNLSLYLVSSVLELTKSIVNLAILLNLNLKQALLKQISRILAMLIALWQYLDPLIRYSIREEQSFILVIRLCESPEHPLLLVLDLIGSNEALVALVLGILKHLVSLLDV